MREPTALLVLDERTTTVLTQPLLKLGDTHVTLSMVIAFALLTTLFFGLKGRLQRWLRDAVLARTGLHHGTQAAIATLAGHAFTAIGLIAILELVGVDLSTLQILAGTLSVGLGFGLKNVVENFAAGLVVLIDRPIRVGDRIKTGEVVGNVVEINTRATTILTNDGIALIVPNASLITAPVTNYTYTGHEVRYSFPVSVGRGNDPARVRAILEDVVRAHPGALAEPRPDVVLKELGSSSLDFMLRVWTRDYVTKPDALISELNFAISEAFQAHGVAGIVPQYDLRLHGEPVALPRA